MGAMVLGVVESNPLLQVRAAACEPKEYESALLEQGEKSRFSRARSGSVGPPSLIRAKAGDASEHVDNAGNPIRAAAAVSIPTPRRCRRSHRCSIARRDELREHSNPFPETAGRSY